jgi:chemotaxis protein MotB
MDGTPIIIKRKKHHAHAHHGGSWKVAYADFVTAMMAFFMVMWIMGLSEDTKQQISGYFNDPMGYSKVQPLSKNIVKFKGMEAPRPGSAESEGSQAFADEQREIEKLAHSIEAALANMPDLKTLLEHLDVTITDEGLRIEFVEDAGAVFFESGRAVIKPEAQRLLAKVGPVLAASNRMMIVEGHTDAQPFGGDPFGNSRLSSARAYAMVESLARSGVSAKQIEQVRAYADTKLKKPDQPYDFSNRRVSILLPYGSDMEKENSQGLPKEILKHEIEGAFRRDFTVAPEPVNLKDSR